MDVGSWLRGLGLERYEAAFRENEIDETVLPTLTADDLKDLGVGVVGHRRKLLNAIAALRADANTKVPLPDTLPTIDRSPKDAAERRHLTVMICDLVGSTALSARLDPEDMRAVIDAYHAACARITRTYDGFLAEFRGDGGGGSGIHSREPLRAGPMVGSDLPQRPRGGARFPARAVTPGLEGRRADRADLGRGGDRQVPSCGGSRRAHRRPAAYAPALPMLALPHQQRASSVHRPVGASRRVQGRRYLRATPRQVGSAPRHGRITTGPSCSAAF